MPLMTIALRYFEEVARQGSLRKAAERLHVAASAVNRQILKLEEELGVPLFERLPRGLRLSSAGELLLYQVRQWQRDERQILGVLGDIRGAGCAEIRIASVESMTDLVLPDVMQRFGERYPQVHFQLLTGLTDTIIERIVSGESDIGICVNPTPNPRVRTLRSASFRFGAVMAADHPLAELPAVRLQDCAEYPVILPDSDMFRGSTLEQALAHHQVEFRVLAECSRVLSIKSLASAGLGIAFLNPLDVAREVQRGELVFRPLKDRPIHGARIDICVARERSMPPALAIFAELLSEALATVEEQPLLDQLEK